MEKRESFSSRLGFLLISAGCAIGLGNVWRFPYITGKYGGGAFVLVYLLFLVILGLPVLVMELSVGRGSQRSIARSFHVLEPEGTKWHWYCWFGIAGNYLLMMFYTVIAGWLLLYCLKMAKGDFEGLDAAGVAAQFNGLMEQPGLMTVFMLLVVLIGMGVCFQGLQNGVERITKMMMVCLLAIMAVLAVRSLTLEGGSEGLRFYLQPNFHNLMYDADGNWILGESIFAAMGQAFFTLSLGIGAIAVFGSYIGKEYSLAGEALRIGVLDTAVAFTAGLIIFPACSAFEVSPGEGPPLIFVTLPNIFNGMAFGRIWGALFFVFLSFAALSTVIAVFENIISFASDMWGWSRRKAVFINFIAIFLLSMPCILGFNIWSGFQPLGPGSNISDLEDFIISNNLLPLGSLLYVLFCVSRKGWGWENFLSEANQGQGLKFPGAVRFYVTYLLPIIVLAVFILGYWDKFSG
ncbi:sodium-dependent transporter [Flavonifractor sp. An100]|uniref:sodium-dependent transporter n=1 Tax=Flavonifractor sp. An100 TaxID=1965538 RepID=UPI000B3AB09D|nr:sodium-dependent transporter [Flavonifractor sp. An100]OUQ81698.1 sodium-dependent transporter [Flavonifractor sp. An100]